MLPDRVSNSGPLAYESGALSIALRGPARKLGEGSGNLSVSPFSHYFSIPTSYFSFYTYHFMFPTTHLLVCIICCTKLGTRKLEEGSLEVRSRMLEVTTGVPQEIPSNTTHRRSSKFYYIKSG